MNSIMMPSLPDFFNDLTLHRQPNLMKLPFNRVATKVRTYFEMRTDGQRFLCLKSRISILRRYL